MRVGLDDQDYSIEKMVKTSGKTGYTRIGSEHVGAGGWRECFRQRHCKEEGMGGWAGCSV